MPEETISIDYVMEKASGPHFSGLRLDGLLSSPPSSTASPSHCSASASSSALSDSNAPKQPFVIGVSGGTASGKTTVCDMIIQELHDHRVVLVNQDSFYRGLTPEESKRVHEYNFDHPDAFDTEQLLDCIQKLRGGQSYQVPIYDFKNHHRSSESFRQVNASDVIILEGILVFHDQRVRNLMNMKIFVDTGLSPYLVVLEIVWCVFLYDQKVHALHKHIKVLTDADVRLARRIRRDTVERGRDINSVLEQYAKFVKPAFDDFVLPSKNQTGQKAHYVGHSLITTLFGMAEFNPKGEPVANFLRALCSYPGVDCYDLLTSISVYIVLFINYCRSQIDTCKNCCLNASTVDLFLKNEPQSTSTKNMVHLAQTKPPIYNLSNIPHDLPIFISYGGQDALSDVRDVELLLDSLKFHDVDKLTIQYIKDYAHADFIMGVNAKDIVYNQKAQEIEESNNGEQSLSGVGSCCFDHQRSNGSSTCCWGSQGWGRIQQTSAHGLQFSSTRQGYTAWLSLAARVPNKSCDLGTALNSMNTGNDVVKLNKPGTRYFACGTLGHCGHGMKVKITVESGTAPSTPESSSSSSSSSSSPAASSASAMHSCFAAFVLLTALVATSSAVYVLNMYM
ncbi:hypothetical protein NC652_003400 [Populus alba x Populus x berolinensis]|nr:hypothetical protein NC652_003400 [Populus alba x Populus x berolinensis]